ncbi:MAG TPA: methyltransferase domain-containing protein [Bacteroidetes bacterium]|nr:methyltransferase domain-containing protein [Bacteroidota bacterium]
MSEAIDFDAVYREFPDYFGRDPDPLLASYVHLLDTSRPVLDVGAGQGRNALFLAELGLPVVALDPSRVAVDTIARIAQEREWPIRIFHDDLASFEASEHSFSAILLFGLLQVLTREEIDSLPGRLNDWIMVGGYLFVTAFTTLDDGYRRTRAKWEEIGPHSFRSGEGEVRTWLEPGELPRLFAGYEMVHYREGLGPLHRHGDSPLERHAKVEAVFRVGRGRQS